jgi:translation initiation factor IF-2
MPKNETKINTEKRAPVVVVMGHIDHGKSTLLDYIRKTNIVDKEAGGITQHLSAYEVTHKDETGEERTITFLDTPGHEAFSKMRERGAVTADIAILVVSAEDSVKAQTLEAWKTIVDSKLPYIVAINKIDKPNANPEKTKNDLTEKGIYLEGYGGDVPFIEISAKTGKNVENLLDLIILVADLQEFTGDRKNPATGVVIESHIDTKRGISATVIIKNGTLGKGDFVVVDDAIVGTRMIENFMGKNIDKASFSSPVLLIGFDKEPAIGSTFETYHTKKEAENAVSLYKELKRESKTETNDQIVLGEECAIIPLIIKTDVSGTCEAIEKEIKKLELENVKFKIIYKGVGDIGEGDIKTASADKNSIIIGFNIKLDSRARDLNEQMHVNVEIFDIIYKLSDFLKEECEKRRPRKMVAEKIASIKILKTFSENKNIQVIGGKVLEGTLALDDQIRILRRDEEIGKGVIKELQHNKIKAKSVEQDQECGLMVSSKVSIASGDILESFKMVEI